MPLHSKNHPLIKLDASESAFLETVIALAQNEIGPKANEVAKQDVFAWETFKTLSDNGVIASAFPTSHGGTQASMALRVRIIEELASVCSTAASLVTGTDLSSRPIVGHATDSVKDLLLHDLAWGKKQAAFALTEPAAGSDVAGLLSTYEENTNGEFVISGEKKFITRADTADYFVVVARKQGSERGAKDLTGFVVDRKSPGLSVSAIIPKMGWYGVPIAMVTLKNVVVPRTHLLSQEGQGMALAQDTLIRARVGHAAIALGRARGALQIASQYANQRTVFGKFVGEHQGIQWMLASMATQLEAARCLVYSTALRYDSKDADISFHASMAKMHATDLGMKMVVDCLQIMGGNGYLKGFPMERFMRDAKMNQIGEGTSEVHKNLIGRHLQKMSASMPLHPCLDLNPDLFMA